MVHNIPQSSQALMWALLVQVSVLRVFQQLLSDASFREKPGATEVCSFAARIVRNIMSKLVPRPAERDAQIACEGAYCIYSSISPTHVLVVTVCQCHGHLSLQSSHSMPPLKAGGEANTRSGSEEALQKGLAAMMFVELLFWKNAHDSEDVRNEYKWKVWLLCPATYKVEHFWVVVGTAASCWHGG